MTNQQALHFDLHLFEPKHGMDLGLRLGFGIRFEWLMKTSKIKKHREEEGGMAVDVLLISSGLRALRIS